MNCKNCRFFKLDREVWGECSITLPPLTLLIDGLFETDGRNYVRFDDACDLGKPIETEARGES